MANHFTVFSPVKKSFYFSVSVSDMASKRKQEEKHLNLLRAMAKLDHNKQCFDCNQKGPTYVDMTVGAFVCTTCSGLL